MIGSYNVTASVPSVTSVNFSLTNISAPNVTPTAATSITDTSATLNGAATPNGFTATGWFRYATSSPGTCTDSFGTRAPASHIPAVRRDKQYLVRRTCQVRRRKGVDLRGWLKDPNRLDGQHGLEL